MIQILTTLEFHLSGESLAIIPPSECCFPLETRLLDRWNPWAWSYPVSPFSESSLSPTRSPAQAAAGVSSSSISFGSSFGAWEACDSCYFMLLVYMCLVVCLLSVDCLCLLVVSCVSPWEACDSQALRTGRATNRRDIIRYSRECFVRGLLVQFIVVHVLSNENIPTKTWMSRVKHPFQVLPYRAPQGDRQLLTACRKEAAAISPLTPGGPCRLEGTTLANRIAASHDYKHS